jgi:hypothetical protein
MTNHRLQSWAYQTARIGKETNLRVLALIKSQNKTQNKKTIFLWYLNFLVKYDQSFRPMTQRP